MMYNMYQLLVNLSLKGDKLPMPNYLREISKKTDIQDFGKLNEFFTSELTNTSLQNEESLDYFFFIVDQALLYFFTRGDHDLYQESLEIVQHRMNAIRNLPSEHVNLEAWEQFLELLSTSFSRLLKGIPIEKFENQIGNLDWSKFGKNFISTVSTVIGFVYLNEEEADQSIKSRVWFQKSILDLSFEENLANQLYLSSYYLKERTNENEERVRQIIEKLESNLENLPTFEIKKVFKSAIFELKSKLLYNIFANFDDDITKLEHCQQELRNLETYFKGQIRENTLPLFAQGSIEKSIAYLYRQLFSMTSDSLEQSNFAKKSIQHIEKAIGIAENTNDKLSTMEYRVEKADIAVDSGISLTEKEVKEIVQFYKKTINYPLFIKSSRIYANLLKRNENGTKAYDTIQDIFKAGQKRIEEGGFYLLTSGFKLANDIFLEETVKPGVSWMVHTLDSFMDRIKKVVHQIEENLEVIQPSFIESFRKQYLRFEPISHFNIKTYFQYQLYEIEMMRIGAIIHKDSVSLQIADRLLIELKDDNNPLSFVKADWDEFKKVSNSVRNSTLNKCINISKGDLPLAAEHLDFSYRNLRSYITFKEVNRLGFFLDIQQTDNKQLEQGIRYMFYDLYKRGTIFEVVFDMPKFLVTHAKSGFFSQDLEEELNIKGTTAKKYIKIMIDIGLIRQDKTTGRKHYYRLIRENIMTRLGKDQTTLIS